MIGYEALGVEMLPGIGNAVLVLSVVSIQNFFLRGSHQTGYPFKRSFLCQLLTLQFIECFRQAVPRPKSLQRSMTLIRWHLLRLLLDQIQNRLYLSFLSFQLWRHPSERPAYFAVIYWCYVPLELDPPLLELEPLGLGDHHASPVVGRLWR